MRNFILILLFLVITFILNVMFYYVSTDYQNFLGGIKSEKIINDVDKPISIDFVNEDIDSTGALTTISPEYKNEEVFIDTDNNKVATREEIVLGQTYRDILRLFSTYDLIELEINTSLFDITDEYPDKYLEYYSKGLTLYFFPTKSYREVYDIFKVLEYELPFTINPINNFGDESFYVNLNEDINDNTIRLVISYKGVVFGLKIKKNEYDLVKEKLNSLKPIETQTSTPNDSIESLGSSLEGNNLDINQIENGEG